MKARKPPTPPRDNRDRPAVAGPSGLDRGGRSPSRDCPGYPRCMRGRRHLCGTPVRTLKPVERLALARVPPEVPSTSAATSTSAPPGARRPQVAAIQPLMAVKVDKPPNFPPTDPREIEEQKQQCWNCRGYGHRWSQCASVPTRFCHRCGRRGYTCATCDSCRGFWEQELQQWQKRQAGKDDDRE